MTGLADPGWVRHLVFLPQGLGSHGFWAKLIPICRQRMRPNVVWIKSMLPWRRSTQKCPHVHKLGMCWKNVDQQVEVIYSQNNVIAIFQREPPSTKNRFEQRKLHCYMKGVLKIWDFMKRVCIIWNLFIFPLLCTKQLWADSFTS